ncbi:MAG: hypothetical protein KHZ61_09090, partial [Lachnospiraceae bacterium]|nr:hypothetical protein [Lachnospiraceae bacterium]
TPITLVIVSQISIFCYLNPPSKASGIAVALFQIYLLTFFQDDHSYSPISCEITTHFCIDQYKEKSVSPLAHAIFLFGQFFLHRNHDLHDL